MTAHRIGVTVGALAIGITVAAVATGPASASASGPASVSATAHGPAAARSGTARPAPRRAAPAYGTWRTVPGPTVPTADNANLTALAMTSPTLGWTSGFTLSATTQNPPFRPLLAMWNGKTWRTITTGLPYAGRLDGLASTSATNAWAVGDVVPNSTTTAPLILHWNGQRWTRVPAPSTNNAYTSLLSVAARSATDAWAVGETESMSGTLRPVIMHWDGHTWRLTSTPAVPPQTGLTSVAVSATGAAWAVGTPFLNSSHGVVLTWNGRSWTTAQTPPTSTSVILDSVTVAGGDVWAVGSASNSTGQFLPYALRWDGTHWAQVPVPAVNSGTLESVTPIGHGYLVAVGSFANGAMYGLWNGRNWTVSTNTKIAQLNVVASDHAAALWAVGSVGTGAQRFRPVVQVNG